MRRRRNERDVDRFHPAIDRFDNVEQIRAAPGGQAARQIQLDHAAHGIAFFFSHGGRADFKFADADPSECRGDFELFVGRENDAGGLRAVAERGIDESESEAFRGVIDVVHL